MALKTPAEQNVARLVAEKVHKEKFLEAAQVINDFCKLGLRLNDNDPKNVLPILQNYLHYLLNEGGTEEAASILWTPNQFTSEPQSVKDIWDLFDRASMGLIMGAASMSKSYSMGVRLMLEWIRDPEWTTIKVVGPSEDHLEQNLFSHLVSLHTSAKLPMPGSTGDLFIGLDRRNQVSAIRGVVIPIGQVKKSGRLQGTKRKPRIKPHPIFGPLSRLFIFIDEFENVPQGIWKDIDNVVSQVEDEGENKSTFKIFGAYNPNDQNNEVGKRAKPVFGWESFDVDSHYKWKSERGWEVLRLDGEKCENVVQGKVVFSGMQTRSGLETTARNSGGRQSAGYMTMGRGAYPPQGVELTIIPPGMIPKCRGEFIWLDDPRPVGAIDLALEGGANASYSLGKLGMATGMKMVPSLEHPNGLTVMFKDRANQITPRWGLQAEQQFVLPKGDTVAMKEEVIRVTKRAGVKPEFFACDRTGHGQGVADLIKYEWSSAIHAINYSQGCSEEKIMVEDAMTCDEEYFRIDSELWFALRAWMEFGYLLFSPAFDLTKLTPQLTQRKFRSVGTKKKVESKKDYMSRGYSSPDDADSIALLVHAARRGQALVLSIRGDAQDSVDSEGPESWLREMEMKGGVYIDASNRGDHL